MFLDLPSGLTVLIPARRHAAAMLFLPIWLVGWFLALRSTLARFRGLEHPLQQEPFLVIWLAGWLIGGAFALLTFFWMAFGRERVSVEAGVLSIRKEILGLGWTLSFDGTRVAKLRVVDEPAERRPSRGSTGLGPKAGPIAFDYGARTVRFGAGVDAAEARVIVERLKQYPLGFGGPGGG